MGFMKTLPKELPTINFSLQDLKPGSLSWSETCNKVRYALEDYGCFVALYPQLSPDLSHDIFNHATKLFELPIETKLKNTKKNLPYRGYIAPIPSLMPHYEAMGIENVTSPQATRNFGDLMWPNGNTEFCDTTDQYAKLVCDLEHIVEKMVFESYDVPESIAGSKGHLLRFLKYTKPESKDVNRFESHTDKNFTTIVAQHDVGGLEVQTRGGDWTRVESKRSELLFMAGDALEVWSNGRVKACQHRVNDCGDKTRYSLALFTFNNNEVQLPKQESTKEELPLKILCGADNSSQSATLEVLCGVEDMSLEPLTCVELIIVLNRRLSKFYAGLKSCLSNPCVELIMVLNGRLSKS